LDAPEDPSLSGELGIARATENTLEMHVHRPHYSEPGHCLIDGDSGKIHASINCGRSGLLMETIITPRLVLDEALRRTQ
jgi:hypothetical protein